MASLGEASPRGTLLSVVVPWRNDPRVLRVISAFASLCNEGTVQLVIVNDDSEQETASLVEACMGQVSNGCVIHSDKHVGPGQARNIGLGKATGSFIAFLDSDDVPHPGRILKMAELGAREELDVVVGGYTVSRSRSTQYIAPPTSGTWPLSGILANALVEYPAVWRFVFRRDFLEGRRASFPKFAYAEDLLFLLGVLEAHPKVGVVRNCVYEHNLSRMRISPPSIRPRRRDTVESAELLIALATQSLSKDVRLLASLWSMLVISRLAVSQPAAALGIVGGQRFPEWLIGEFNPKVMGLLARRLTGRYRSPKVWRSLMAHSRLMGVPDRVSRDQEK